MAKTKLRKRLGNWIKENKTEFIVLLLIILLGAFLRLYKINEYMTFLGDEGRDAIVVRRLLVNFDPILIGPGTSIGNMYLGPLYYYMMAPALFLSNLNPVGPAIMIALLGVTTVFIVWYMARIWFGKIAAPIASLLYAIAPTVIIYSRSSWNPNIMPFFAVLVIFSIWKHWFDKSYKWIIITAVSMAFVLQSHYLGLLLIPTVGVFWFLTLVNILRDKKKGLKKFAGSSVVGLLLFSILMSPLAIFDWRHDWRNFSAMGEFFAKRQTTVSARPWNAIPKLPEIASEISTRLVVGRNEEFGITAIVLILALLVIALSKLDIKKKGFKDIRVSAFFLIIVWIGFALVGLGVYKQEIYDHYYGFFFAAPFLLIGGISQVLVDWNKKVGGVIAVSLVLFLAFHSIKEIPIKHPGNNQLKRSEDVAQFIDEKSEGNKFNFAVIAERNYEGAYQYFLERDNTPFIIIDETRPESITDRLFVVCELPEKTCSPTTNDKAGIAHFGMSDIEDTWSVYGVTVYSLVHKK